MDAENPSMRSRKATRRTVSKEISRLIAYAAGKEILIVGPSSAGKTKFAEYLRLGVLDPEGTREMTYHLSKSPAFIVQVGPQQNLTLMIRRAVDTPGQTGPVHHANLVGRRKPHIIVVMVDCSKPIFATLKWLRLFSDRLDTVLRKGSYAQKRLDGILVILNKRDKINSGEAHRLRRDIKDVLIRYLSIVLGDKRVLSIPIRECISVQTPRGTALIDKVIQELAERLAH